MSNYGDLTLINEINDMQIRLDNALKALKKYGIAKAQAEKEYKTLLRQTALRLRDSGMAIGMINMTIYGEEDVAEARFKRDVALTMYETAEEGINVLKLEIRVLDAQIQREWGMANG